MYNARLKDWPAIEKGTLVSFELPYATTLDLIGSLKGIVISRTAHNIASGRPLVCPIVYGESEANEALGIQVPTQSPVPSFLRPDLVSTIAIPYGKITPVIHKHTSEAFIFPHEITDAALKQFVLGIRPTFEKIAERAQGFLPYGSVYWINQFPRIAEAKTDIPVAVCLTAPTTYRLSCMAQMIRGFTHYERYNPKFDVAISPGKWIATNFLSANEITVMPAKKCTLALRSGQNPIALDEQALRGIAKKLSGAVSEPDWNEICAKYTTPIGRLPPRILTAHRHNTRHQPYPQYSRR